jgi:hypothetical protein
VTGGSVLEPFGVGCPSDHRVLWADFTYEDAFGVSGTPLVQPGVRRLNTKNPRLFGWYNFLMGRPSARWSEVQQRYYKWLQQKNTGKAWTQALIKKIWAVLWDMWDHCNKVRTSSITPAKLRAIEALNHQIELQFDLGKEGLSHKDHHWLSESCAHVFTYDSEHNHNGCHLLS